MKKIFLTLIILILGTWCFSAKIPYSIVKIDNSGKYAELVVKYPVFKGNSDLINVTNTAIKETLKNHIEQNKIFISEYGDKDGYINTAYPTIVRADEKIISIVWHGDWNAGGVHNDIVYTLTSGYVNGKAKVLKIDDVYDKRKACNDIIYAYKQSKYPPQQLVDGELTADTLFSQEEGLDILNNFTISDKYITFYRPEYCFGYGYEGADFVKIPYTYKK